MQPSTSLRTHFLSALLLLWAGLSGLLAQKPLVIIDPGHGGKDPGAHYGIYEKTVNLQLALALERRLHDLDIDTAITRDHDTYLSLADRARFPEKFAGPKLFVSLHYNAHARTGANGIETFFHSATSRSLALRIQQALIGRTQAFDRGIKQRKNLGVLRSNKAPVAVLIEGGFLSNPTERSYIAHPGYRDLQALAIAEAIAGYVGKPLRPTPARVFQVSHRVVQQPASTRPGPPLAALRSQATRSPVFPRLRSVLHRRP